MLRTSTRALVVYDGADAGVVSPFLAALQNLGCLAGQLPGSAQLQKRWRDRARGIIEDATVGVFIVSETSLQSVACIWQLQALADHNVPVVLLFASPVPLVELHSTLKFPNIDWTQSRSLPQAADTGLEGTDQLLASLAERRHPRRRKPLSKRQILQWVGSNAVLPPSMMLDQMAFISRVGSSEANRTTRTLSIAELRTKRFEALPETRYARAARKDGTSVKRDRVDCSVFAPAAVQIKQPFKLQALLHLQDDLEKATSKAEAADPFAERLTTETLQMEIKRGSRVELSLECPGLQVRDRTKKIQWLGDPKQAVWNAAYRGPPTESIRPKLTAMVNGIPVGYLEFDLHVVAGEPSKLDPDWKRARARAYEKAFISYARSDFERVSYYAEAIDECTGMQLLFDVTSLEPGDDWAEWIKGSIPDTDLFMLMWSKSAADSDWVDRECRLAMRTNRSFGNPDIKPIVLERSAPKPPTYLRHLHFSTKYLDRRIAERNPLFT